MPGTEGDFKLPADPSPFGTSVRTRVVDVGSGVFQEQEVVTLADGDGGLIKFAPVVGTWGYKAGINGAVSVPAGGRVLQVTAIALGAAGTFTINGGDTITLPYDSGDKASSSITFSPKGNLVAPTFVFDGSVDAYMIEFVT